MIRYCLIALVLFFSCSEKQDTQTIYDVDSKIFQDLLKKNPSVLIDVRTKKEFNEGHIDGATNVNLYDSDFLKKINLVNKNQPIYVYCRSGGRSSMAASKMKDIGFTEIYNLSGGIDSWIDEENLIIHNNFANKEVNTNHQIFDLLLFDELLLNNNYTLLYFNTEWCYPCIKMRPIVNQFKQSNSYNIDVLLINLDVNSGFSKKYNLNGIPVCILFHKDVEIWRNVGILSFEELDENIHISLSSLG